MELIVAVSVLVVLTLIYAFSSIRAHRELEQARSERNVIYRTCFLRGLSGILAKIAGADGTVDASEQEIANRLFEDMGLSTADAKLCRDEFRAAKESTLPPSYYASIFVPYSTRESRGLVYEILWDIVVADGKIEEHEEKMLRELITWLSIDPAQFERNLRAHSGKLTSLKDSAGKLERVLK